MCRGRISSIHFHSFTCHPIPPTTAKLFEILRMARSMLPRTIDGVTKIRLQTELISRIASGSILAILDSWITALISPWVDTILAYRVVQMCAMIITVQSLRSLLTFYDASPNTDTRKTDLSLSIATVVIQLVLFQVNPEYSVPFCSSCQTILLVNHYGIRKLGRPLIAKLDNQVSDGEAIINLLGGIAQLLIFLSPGRVLAAFVLSYVVAETCLFIWISSDFQAFSPTWKRLTNLLLFGLMPLWAILSALISATTRISSSLDKWRSARAQQATRQYPEYHYTPLKAREIRLLRLCRKESVSEPRCEMLTVSIDKAPPYEAVSHAWEHPIVYKPMIVGGSSRLNVPSRIYDYLRHRYSYFSSKLIWVDALCIRQDDLEEKADQVRLMRDIFGNASRVNLWVASIHEAPDALSLRAHLLWTRTVQAMTSNPKYIQDMTSRTAPTKTAVHRFLESRYFTRIWMVQEVALARQVHIFYGSVCLGWGEIEDFVTLAQDPLHLTSHLEVVGRYGDVNLIQRSRALNNVQYMSALRASVQADRVATQTTPQDVQLLTSKEAAAAAAHQFLLLETVMIATMTFDSTDPRDRIFALIGTIHDPSATLPTPNYQDSYSKTYYEAMELLLSKGTRPMTSLLFAGIGLRREGLAAERSALPSWTPDFTNHLEVSGGVYRRPDTQGTLKVEVVRLPGAAYSVIKLRMASLDTLSALGPVCRHAGPHSDQNYDDPPGAKWALETKKFASEHRRSGSGETAACCFDAKAFWRTFFADRFQDECPMPAEVLTSISEEVEAVFRCWVEAGDDAEAKAKLKSMGRDTLDKVVAKVESVVPGLHEENESKRHSWQKVGYSLCQTSLGRRFGITDQGRYVLTPPLTQKGDVVCMFEGLKEPFLLRRTPISGRYWLVGVCYVDEFDAISPSQSGHVYEDIFLV